MTPAGSSGNAHRRSTVSRARLYLAAGTVLSLFVAFVVFAAAWSEYAIGERVDYLAQQVAVLAKGQAAAEALEPETSTDTRDRLLRIEAGLIGAALFVTDDSGAVQRSTTATSTAPLPVQRLTDTKVDGVSAARLKTAAGVPVLVVAAPIDTGHRLVAVQSLAEIRRAQRGLLAIALLALGAAAVVAYVAGGALARRLTAPLVRLETAADHVAAGDFGTQVAQEGDVETASLAKSFNRMSRHVADAYAAQKAFVGDVSHEIRTPLTSIRGFAEALLDGVIEDPERQRAALTVIRDEATRIGEMSKTLLALSELDAGAVLLARDSVDVAVLGDVVRGRFDAYVAEAGVDFEVRMEPGPLADADRLLQVITALTSNALAHTPKGGVVRVDGRVVDDLWVLTVEDSGPGVPAEDRTRIFERFARLDESRMSESGGAGLGLAIAQRLVELMDGRIEVSSGDLGGARFTVSLPLARQSVPPRA